MQLGFLYQVFFLFVEGRLLQWPYDIEITWDAKDFINELLQYHNTERIGSYYRGGISTIKSHTFFNSINWGSVLHTTPEILPTIAGEEDTSYLNGKIYSISKTYVWNISTNILRCFKLKQTVFNLT